MNPTPRKVLRSLIGAMMAPLAIIWNPQPHPMTVQLSHEIHELKKQQAKNEETLGRHGWDIARLYALANAEQPFYQLPIPHREDSPSI